MKTFEAAPPAKINLVLRVFRRLRGPLHHVHSLMQTIGWCDELTVTRRLRPGVDCRCEGLEGSDIRENLVFRAAEIIMREGRLREGVRIRLKKRIPDAAGLGGGSSDAAAVIRGMCRLWDLPWSLLRQERIALCLGSDVPFFLRGGLSEVRGVGEQVSPWPDRLTRPIGVITFPFKIPTRWAFQKLDQAKGTENMRGNLTRGRRAVTIWHRWIRMTNTPRGRVYAHNDFFPVIGAQYPQVEAVRRWLDHQGAACVGMTGKGPTLFALGENSRQMDRVKRAIGRVFPDCRMRVVSARYGGVDP